MNMEAFIFTVIYIFFVICNISLMRDILIVDKNKIESYLDILISIVLIFIPIFGTIFLMASLEEHMTSEYRKAKKEKARKIMNKIFFIK